MQMNANNIFEVVWKRINHEFDTLCVCKLAR